LFLPKSGDAVAQGCPGRWWSPSLEVFQNVGHVALRDVVMGMVGWVGLGDLSVLFNSVFSSLNDSVS